MVTVFWATNTFPQKMQVRGIWMPVDMSTVLEVMSQWLHSVACCCCLLQKLALVILICCPNIFISFGQQPGIKVRKKRGKKQQGSEDKTLIINEKKTEGKQKKVSYFPMQNFEKIFPNKSSVLTSPSISPKKANARRISMATKSDVTPWSSPRSTSSRLSEAFCRAS